MLDYAAPSTVEEAAGILAGAPGAAKVLSGGTDLLVQLRSGRAKPGMPLYRRLEKNAQIAEFRCVAFVEELLYGKFRKQAGK
jgi:hypothetical protein